MNLDSTTDRGATVGMFGRAVRHLLVGGIGTLMYSGLVALFVEVVKLHPVMGVLPAFLVVMIYTYVFNRFWVYSPTRSHAYSIPRFLAVAGTALALNAGIMYTVVNWMELWYLWGLVATALIVPPTNFLLNYFWAFR